MATDKACSSGHQHPILLNAWLGFDGCGRVVTICELSAGLRNLHKYAALDSEGQIKATSRSSGTTHKHVQAVEYRPTCLLS